MSKERKPVQAVFVIELEDNVGAVLAKRKIVVPVSTVEDFNDMVDGLEKQAQ